MTEKKEFEESIRFVARNFRNGALLPYSGWKRFRQTHRISTYRSKISAASIVAVVLAASASLYYSYTTNKDTQEPVSIQISESQDIEKEKTEKIYFKDTPLKDVVVEIERVYDISIINVPQEEMRITISYEGTASDLIETINDLMNTSLKIIPKSELDR
ncbi:MAG: DUF4974 domain-containing protein [Muribaculaceae bacterium]|nr:DUF4974 domain-containing protein [Muribaculaceae bacterium]